jgi:hypothetical protein
VGEEIATVVGGVWSIAAVAAEDWIQVKRKPNKGEQIEYKMQEPGPKVANRFSVLQSELDNEDYEKIRPSPARSQEVVTKKSVRFNKCKGGRCEYPCETTTPRAYPQEAVPMPTNDMSTDVASICAVPFASCCGPPGLEARRWNKIGAGERIVDSAAEESVCPKDWCKDFGTKTPERWLKFVNASGGAMGHYGERTANFKVDGKGSGIMSLNFQVSDVQKPLVAVRRITEKGNVVQFGPKEEDNYIQNKVTGTKIAMIKKGGSYVIPAEMLVEDFPRQAP